jgi:hypothetical protein
VLSDIFALVEALEFFGTNAVPMRKVGWHDGTGLETFSQHESSYQRCHSTAFKTEKFVLHQKFVKAL